jgi:hypothetical protein
MGDISTDEIALALDQLRGLVDKHLPKRFYPSMGLWPPIAAAMITRMADIARSTAVLLRADCHLDAVVMTRVMYEQAIVFCWIAADPGERLVHWQRAERAAALKAHREASDYGLTVLTPDEVEKAKDFTGLSVWNLVREVDAFWPEKVKGFRKSSGEKAMIDILTLSGLYLGVYRVASRPIHAHPESLELSLRAKPPSSSGYVVEHVPTKKWGLVATVVPVFAMALMVHHHLFDWPDADAVRTVNQRLAWEQRSPKDG